MEYYKNSKRSQEIRERKLRDSLTEIGEMSEDQINKIVKDVQDDDSFLKAQEALNTPYKRNKFIQERFQYVPPIEITLNTTEVEKGNRKDSFHYIPLEAALKNLLEDPSYQQIQKPQSNNHDDQIVDIQDWSSFKSNKFFKTNPGALSLFSLLFSITPLEHCRDC